MSELEEKLNKSSVECAVFHAPVGIQQTLKLNQVSIWSHCFLKKKGPENRYGAGVATQFFFFSWRTWNHRFQGTRSFVTRICLIIVFVGWIRSRFVSNPCTGWLPDRIAFSHQNNNNYTSICLGFGYPKPFEFFVMFHLVNRLMGHIFPWVNPHGCISEATPQVCAVESDEQKLLETLCVVWCSSEVPWLHMGPP